MPLQIPTLGRGIHANVRSPVFPLSVSANGRYLQSADGTPFRVQCDAVWLATTRSNSSEWDTYIADRKARGFNTVILMAIAQSGYQSFGTGSEPNNRAGNPPFNTPGDFSTPNTAYFNYIETLVSKANTAGLLVFLFYTYWGFSAGDQGWWTELGANSTPVCTAWGAFLGNKLKAYPNIILGTGGDFSSSTGTEVTRTKAILAGIRSAGGYATKWLAGNEWNNPDTLATAQAGFTYGTDPTASDQNLATFYGCGPSGNGQTFTTAASSYAASPTLPSIIQEACYVGETNLPGIDGSRPNMRAYHYWAVLGGSTAGQCFGQHFLWNWETTGGTIWSDTLASNESIDVSKAFGLYAQLRWHTHAPAQSRVVSGVGSGGSTVVCSLASDGTSMLAYRATNGTGTQTYDLDLRGMSGPTRARWFNPTTGVFTPEATGLSNALSSRTFVTPGNNGTGTNDWVLVLDA